MGERSLTHVSTRAGSGDGERDARIEDLERKIDSLTKVLGTFAVKPPPTRGECTDMIGFAATPPISSSADGRGQNNMAGLPAQEDRARFVRDHIRQRRMRDQLFIAEDFADPVWDMMLDLYAAYCEGHAVSVSSLRIASAVPASTALRWIKTLTARGWFLRDRDETDGRRIYVYLSDEIRLKLEKYIDGLQP
ncbi:MAG: hypothetical protein EOP62_23090 [Sphingomonadales bacterium]|nr:MAG: hypothetical protein EOP62_23090 [Sphingomonadales bacterium]